jgi:hypothetical protein
MSLKPSPDDDLLVAMVMAVTVWSAVGAVWAWYGFPRYIEAAFILVALSCIGAFVWMKSRH